MSEPVQFFYPSEEMVRNAAVSGMDAYRALCAEAEADYEGFWARHARDKSLYTNPWAMNRPSSR